MKGEMKGENVEKERYYLKKIAEMNEQEHQYRQTLWRSQCAAITHHTRTQAHTHKKGEGALHPCCFCLCTDRRRRRNLVIFPFSRFSVFAAFFFYSVQKVFIRLNRAEAHSLERCRGGPQTLCAA